MIIKRKKIGEILIENGLITRDQLSLALKIQERDKNGLLGIILIQLKYITPEQLMKCLDLQKRDSKKDP
jgi:type IV pilus assembly protein PilB